MNKLLLFATGALVSGPIMIIILIVMMGLIYGIVAIFPETETPTAPYYQRCPTCRFAPPENK